MAIRIFTRPIIEWLRKWDQLCNQKVIKLRGFILIEIFIKTLLGPWEPRQAFTYPLWWLPLCTVIKAREKAINTHKTLLLIPITLSLYIDGSGLDSHIGAVVVVPQMRFTQ